MEKALGILAVLAILFASACGGAPPATEPAPPDTTLPTQPSPPIAVPSPTATQPPAPPTDAPTSAGEPGGAEEVDLGLGSDLTSLSSYRATYVYRWESTKDGTTESGTWQVSEEVVRQPPARRLIWSSPDQGDETFEIIEVGDRVYFLAGDTWMEMDSGEDSLLSPDDFLSDPLGALSGSRGKLVQSNVVVNGVATDQYTFDESTLSSTHGLGGVATARGDVWVSRQHGVVVKYEARFEGQELAATSGGAGALEMVYDLTDLNEPITIEPPAAFQAAMPQDIPLLDDAKEVAAFMGTVTYRTSRSVEEAQAFYDAQMVAMGWTSAGGFPGFSSFTRDGRTAQVVMTPDDGETVVTVSTGEQ